jgi:hypothetical protein
MADRPTGRLRCKAAARTAYDRERHRGRSYAPGERDREWPGAAFAAGVIEKDRIGALLGRPMPRNAPDLAELLRRLDIPRPPANS